MCLYIKTPLCMYVPKSHIAKGMDATMKDSKSSSAEAEYMTKT